ncbi:MAG: Rrf2 family transcriptional regulator [Gammaproteobacteria bacterium]|nr:Rrf2 family transcriptional regulator [Gammaproteobacteria bacterium]
MKLTSYTNYALRSLQLAALRAPALVRIEDVVQVHALAKPHVRKVVHELGRADLLVTQRGRGGGFQLARPANTIVVGDVVRLTEGKLEVVECFNSETNTCPLIGICKLSRAIQQATAAFMAVLDDLTIADIASNKAQLLNRIAPLVPLEELDYGTSTKRRKGVL